MTIEAEFEVLDERLTFGGVKRNHLFITVSTSVHALLVNFNGASPRTANTR